MDLYTDDVLDLKGGKSKEDLVHLVQEYATRSTTETLCWTLRNGSLVIRQGEEGIYRPYLEQEWIDCRLAQVHGNRTVSWNTNRNKIFYSFAFAADIDLDCDVTCNDGEGNSISETRSVVTNLIRQDEKNIEILNKFISAMGNENIENMVEPVPMSKLFKDLVAIIERWDVAYRQNVERCIDPLYAHAINGHVGRRHHRAPRPPYQYCLLTNTMLKGLKIVIYPTGLDDLLALEPSETEPVHVMSYFAYNMELLKTNVLDLMNSLKAIVKSVSENFKFDGYGTKNFMLPGHAKNQIQSRPYHHLQYRRDGCVLSLSNDKVVTSVGPIACPKFESWSVLFKRVCNEYQRDLESYMNVRAPGSLAFDHGWRRSIIDIMDDGDLAARNSLRSISPDMYFCTVAYMVIIKNPNLVLSNMPIQHLPDLERHFMALVRNGKYGQLSDDIKNAFTSMATPPPPPPPPPPPNPNSTSSQQDGQQQQQQQQQQPDSSQPSQEQPSPPTDESRTTKTDWRNMPFRNKRVADTFNGFVDLFKKGELTEQDELFNEFRATQCKESEDALFDMHLKITNKMYPKVNVKYLQMRFVTPVENLVTNTIENRIAFGIVRNLVRLKKANRFDRPLAQVNYHHLHDNIIFKTLSELNDHDEIFKNNQEQDQTSPPASTNTSVITATTSAMGEDGGEGEDQQQRGPTNFHNALEEKMLSSSQHTSPYYRTFKSCSSRRPMVKPLDPVVPHANTDNMVFGWLMVALAERFTVMYNLMRYPESSYRHFTERVSMVYSGKGYSQYRNFCIQTRNLVDRIVFPDGMHTAYVRCANLVEKTKTLAVRNIDKYNTININIIPRLFAHRKAKELEGCPPSSSNRFDEIQEVLDPRNWSSPSTTAVLARDEEGLEQVDGDENEEEEEEEEDGELLGVPNLFLGYENDNDPEGSTRNGSDTSDEDILNMNMADCIQLGKIVKSEESRLLLCDDQEVYSPVIMNSLADMCGGLFRLDEFTCSVKRSKRNNGLSRKTVNVDRVRDMNSKVYDSFFLPFTTPEKYGNVDLRNCEGSCGGQCRMMLCLPQNTFIMNLCRVMRYNTMRLERSTLLQCSLTMGFLPLAQALSSCKGTLTHPNESVPYTVSPKVQVTRDVDLPASVANRGQVLSKALVTNKMGNLYDIIMTEKMHSEASGAWIYNYGLLQITGRDYMVTTQEHLLAHSLLTLALKTWHVGTLMLPFQRGFLPSLLDVNTIPLPDTSYFTQYVASLKKVDVKSIVETFQGKSMGGHVFSVLEQVNFLFNNSLPINLSKEIDWLGGFNSSNEVYMVDEGSAMMMALRFIRCIVLAMLPSTPAWKSNEIRALYESKHSLPKWIVSFRKVYDGMNTSNDPKILKDFIQSSEFLTSNNMAEKIKLNANYNGEDSCRYKALEEHEAASGDLTFSNALLAYACFRTCFEGKEPTDLVRCGDNDESAEDVSEAARGFLQMYRFVVKSWSYRPKGTDLELFSSLMGKTCIPDPMRDPFFFYRFMCFSLGYHVFSEHHCRTLVDGITNRVEVLGHDASQWNKALSNHPNYLMFGARARLLNLVFSYLKTITKGALDTDKYIFGEKDVGPEEESLKNSIVRLVARRVGTLALAKRSMNLNVLDSDTAYLCLSSYMEKSGKDPFAKLADVDALLYSPSAKVTQEDTNPSFTGTAMTRDILYHYKQNAFFLDTGIDTLRRECRKNISAGKASENLTGEADVTFGKNSKSRSSAFSSSSSASSSSPSSSKSSGGDGKGKSNYRRGDHGGDDSDTALGSSASATSSTCPYSSTLSSIPGHFIFPPDNGMLKEIDDFFKTAFEVCENGNVLGTDDSDLDIGLQGAPESSILFNSDVDRLAPISDIINESISRIKGLSNLLMLQSPKIDNRKMEETLADAIEGIEAWNQFVRKTTEEAIWKIKKMLKQTNLLLPGVVDIPNKEEQNERSAGNSSSSGRGGGFNSKKPFRNSNIKPNNTNPNNKRTGKDNGTDMDNNNKGPSGPASSGGGAGGEGTGFRNGGGAGGGLPSTVITEEYALSNATSQSYMDVNVRKKLLVNIKGGDGVLDRHTSIVRSILETSSEVRGSPSTYPGKLLLDIEEEAQQVNDNTGPHVPNPSTKTTPAKGDDLGPTKKNLHESFEHHHELKIGDCRVPIYPIREATLCSNGLRPEYQTWQFLSLFKRDANALHLSTLNGFVRWCNWYGIVNTNNVLTMNVKFEMSDIKVSPEVVDVDENRTFLTQPSANPVTPIRHKCMVSGDLANVLISRSKLPSSTSLARSIYQHVAKNEILMNDYFHREVGLSMIGVAGQENLRRMVLKRERERKEKNLTILQNQAVRGEVGQEAVLTAQAEFQAYVENEGGASHDTNQYLNILVLPNQLYRTKWDDESNTIKVIRQPLADNLKNPRPLDSADVNSFGTVNGFKFLENVFVECLTLYSNANQSNTPIVLKMIPAEREVQVCPVESSPSLERIRFQLRSKGPSQKSNTTYRDLFQEVMSRRFERHPMIKDMDYMIHFANEARDPIGVLYRKGHGPSLNPKALTIANTIVQSITPHMKPAQGSEALKRIHMRRLERTRKMMRRKYCHAMAKKFVPRNVAKNHISEKEWTVREFNPSKALGSTPNDKKSSFYGLLDMLGYVLMEDELSTAPWISRLRKAIIANRVLNMGTRTALLSCHTMQDMIPICPLVDFKEKPSPSSSSSLDLWSRFMCGGPSIPPNLGTELIEALKGSSCLYGLCVATGDLKQYGWGYRNKGQVATYMDPIMQNGTLLESSMQWRCHEAFNASPCRYYESPQNLVERGDLQQINSKAEGLFFGADMYMQRYVSIGSDLIIGGHMKEFTLQLDTMVGNSLEMEFKFLLMCLVDIRTQANAIIPAVEGSKPMTGLAITEYTRNISSTDNAFDPSASEYYYASDPDLNNVPPSSSASSRYYPTPSKFKPPDAYLPTKERFFLQSMYDLVSSKAHEKSSLTNPALLENLRKLYTKLVDPQNGRVNYGMLVYIRKLFFFGGYMGVNFCGDGTRAHQMLHFICIIALNMMKRQGLILHGPRGMNGKTFMVESLKSSIMKNSIIPTMPQLLSTHNMNATNAQANLKGSVGTGATTLFMDELGYCQNQELNAHNPTSTNSNNNNNNSKSTDITTAVVSGENDAIKKGNDFWETVRHRRMMASVTEMDKVEESDEEEIEKEKEEESNLITSKDIMLCQVAWIGEKNYEKTLDLSPVSSTRLLVYQGLSQLGGRRSSKACICQRIPELIHTTHCHLDPLGGITSPTSVVYLEAIEAIKSSPLYKSCAIISKRYQDMSNAFVELYRMTRLLFDARPLDRRSMVLILYLLCNEAEKWDIVGFMYALGQMEDPDLGFLDDQEEVRETLYNYTKKNLPSRKEVESITALYKANWNLKSNFDREEEQQRNGQQRSMSSLEDELFSKANISQRVLTIPEIDEFVGHYHSLYGFLHDMGDPLDSKLHHHVECIYKKLCEMVHWCNDNMRGLLDVNGYCIVNNRMLEMEGVFSSRWKSVLDKILKPVDALKSPCLRYIRGCISPANMPCLPWKVAVEERKEENEEEDEDVDLSEEFGEGPEDEEDYLRNTTTSTNTPKRSYEHFMMLDKKSLLSDYENIGSLIGEKRFLRNKKTDEEDSTDDQQQQKEDKQERDKIVRKAIFARGAYYAMHKYSALLSDASKDFYVSKNRLYTNAHLRKLLMVPEDYLVHPDGGSSSWNVPINRQVRRRRDVNRVLVKLCGKDGSMMNFANYALQPSGLKVSSPSEMLPVTTIRQKGKYNIFHGKRYQSSKVIPPIQKHQINCNMMKMLLSPGSEAMLRGLYQNAEITPMSMQVIGCTNQHALMFIVDEAMSKRLTRISMDMVLKPVTEDNDAATIAKNIELTLKRGSALHYHDIARQLGDRDSVLQLASIAKHYENTNKINFGHQTNVADRTYTILKNLTGLIQSKKTYPLNQSIDNKKISKAIKLAFAVWCNIALNRYLTVPSSSSSSPPPIPIPPPAQPTNDDEFSLAVQDMDRPSLAKNSVLNHKQYVLVSVQDLITDDSVINKEKGNDINYQLSDDVFESILFVKAPFVNTTKFWMKNNALLLQTGLRQRMNLYTMIRVPNVDMHWPTLSQESSIHVNHFGVPEDATTDITKKEIKKETVNVLEVAAKWMIAWNTSDIKTLMYPCHQLHILYELTKRHLGIDSDHVGESHKLDLYFQGIALQYVMLMTNRLKMESIDDIVGMKERGETTSRATGSADGKLHPIMVANEEMENILTMPNLAHKTPQVLTAHHKIVQEIMFSKCKISVNRHYLCPDCRASK